MFCAAAATTARDQLNAIGYLYERSQPMRAGTECDRLSVTPADSRSSCYIIIVSERLSARRHANEATPEAGSALASSLAQISVLPSPKKRLTRKR